MTAQHAGVPPDGRNVGACKWNSRASPQLFVWMTGTMQQLGAIFRFATFGALAAPKIVLPATSQSTLQNETGVNGYSAFRATWMRSETSEILRLNQNP
jgi:hypothetical protein